MGSTSPQARRFVAAGGRGMSNKAVLIGWRKRWNRSLLQFLGRRARTRVDIEDLAQETYLRLLRSTSLREVRNPQAYLMRVASHVVTGVAPQSAANG